jgi:holo-[acyl-carrier protein] synthase
VILGLGTDLVAVARIRTAWQRHGDRLAERVLTPAERQTGTERADFAAYLASRFAAKEAGAKALGTGFRDGIRLRDIEVQRAPGGPPRLHWHGPAAEQAAWLGMVRSHLSLSDDGAYAMATVIIEGKE